MMRFCGVSVGYLFVPVLALSGCGFTGNPTGGGQTVALHGQVRGGQQPIAGARVQLYASGTAAYAAGATSLLTTPVTTAADGSFGLTGDYSCPSLSSQLYLVASGGNPGLPAGTDNAAIAEMVALGPCSLYAGQYTLNPNLFISVNEVTTVAAVYALRGFMDPSTSQVGTSSTNAQGLVNAFLAVNNLVNLSTGVALTSTPAGNGTAPQAEIDTLGNILAACVNSTGNGAPCTSLFAAATFLEGPAPTTILQAIYNIASNPANQVSTLYNLTTSAPPFQPSLSKAPNDWTVALQFNGGNVSGPGGSGTLAIDAQGDVWALSNPYNQTPSIAKFSNNGALLSGASGYTGGGLGGSTSIAIDPSGNAWVVGTTNANVVKLSSSGAILSGAGGYTGGGLSRPESIAIDGSGNAWVTDNASQAVIKLGPTGTILSGTTGFGLSSTPAGIGIDRTGNAWVSEDGGGSVFELNSSGGLLSASSGYTTGGVSALQVGFDLGGNVWTNSAAQQTLLAKLSGAGSLLSPTGGYASCTPPYSPYIAGRSCFWYAGQPFALDGAGNVWVTSDFVTGTGGASPIYTYTFAIAEVSNTGTILSGSNGYTGGFSQSCSGIAVDASGDVWLAASSGSLLEFVGAGTPLVTPFSMGVQNGRLGMKP